MGLCSNCGRQVRVQIAQEMEMVNLNLHPEPVDDSNDPHRPDSGYDSRGLRCRRCRHCPQGRARKCLATMGIIMGLVFVGCIALGVRGMMRVSQRIARPCPTVLSQNQRYILQGSYNATRPASCSENRGYTRSQRVRRDPPHTHTNSSSNTTTPPDSTTASVTESASLTSSRMVQTSSINTSRLRTNATESSPLSEVTVTSGARAKITSSAVSLLAGRSSTSTTPRQSTPESRPQATTSPLRVPLVSESSYQTDMQANVDPIWDCRHEGTISVRDSSGGCVDLRTVTLEPANSLQNRGDVLIVTGRGECVDKWRETMAELRQAGYRVHSYDHRGQGNSTRLLPDPHLGHVGQWEDYTDDLRAVVGALGLGQNASRPLHVMGHSMGGTVVCDWMETTPPGSLTSATLTSPMMGIKMGWMQKAATWVGGSWVGRGMLSQEGYVPGKAGNVNRTTPFEENGNTGSKARHEDWQKIEKNCGKVEPSMGWLRQAMRGGQRCVDNANNIPDWVPLKMFTGGKDTKVDAQAQQNFWARAGYKNPHSNMTKLTDCKHEPFMESDDTRDGVMKETLKFMKEAEAAQQTKQNAKSRKTRSAENPPTGKPMNEQNQTQPTSPRTDRDSTSPQERGPGGKYMGKSKNGNPQKRK